MCAVNAAPDADDESADGAAFSFFGVRIEVSKVMGVHVWWQLAAGVVNICLPTVCTIRIGTISDTMMERTIGKNSMGDPTKKPFYLRADEIRSLATGHGGCLATDMITCAGRKVGFMYREAPDNHTDSGWRFMSGDESQDYLDDPNNLAIYDVNTVANYDPDVIPHLGAPIGSAFERENGIGPLVQVHNWSSPTD